MNRQNVYTVLLLISFQGTLALAASPSVIVHLPRTISVKQSDVLLGQVCAIHGDETLSEKAREIKLGHLYTPAQQLKLTRPQILSRLTSCGIKPEQIRMSGSVKVQISRSNTSITADELVSLAHDCLKKQLKPNIKVVIEPLRVPKDLKLGLDEKEQIELVPQLLRSNDFSQACIRITAMINGKAREIRDVTFRLQYPNRVVRTIQSVPAGQPLTQEHIKIETQLASTPEPADWKTPLGLTTKRAIPAGAPIRDSWLHKPVVKKQVIKRNSAVVIQVVQPGLSIRTMGQMVTDGHIGDVVKVKNVTSNRIILCRVQEDGSVQPIL